MSKRCEYYIGANLSAATVKRGKASKTEHGIVEDKVHVLRSPKHCWERLPAEDFSTFAAQNGLIRVEIRDKIDLPFYPKFEDDEETDDAPVFLKIKIIDFIKNGGGLMFLARVKEKDPDREWDAVISFTATSFINQQEVDLLVFPMRMADDRTLDNHVSFFANYSISFKPVTK